MSKNEAGASAPATTVVLGLGNIGSAVAECLATAGEPVVGVDPFEEARRAFGERCSAVTAPSVGDVTLAPQANVFVVVRRAAEAIAVLDELAARASDATVYVLTTLDTDSAEALAIDRGALRVIELPVSGGRQGALDGTLTVLASGPLTDADREFLRRTIAGYVIEFGSYGEPTAAKLHNNLLAALHAVAHARVIELAATNGVDPVRFAELVDHGSAGSWMGTNLAVVVDDLLIKDVELYEQCFGEIAPLVLTGVDGVGAVLDRARRLIAPGKSTS